MALGTAQDGGYPHAGCMRACCAAAWKDPALRRNVACLGIVDPGAGAYWMIDATPDFRKQLHMLQTAAPHAALRGILLTHAHMGHYPGLLFLGREAMAASELPVYTMPRMAAYLQDNLPWSALIDNGSIRLYALDEHTAYRLSERISITPFTVPHRDENSETVGFTIEGSDRSVMYIPDIDSWSAWDTSLEDLICRHDRAYLDATFFSASELPGRDIALVPHPMMKETMELLAGLTLKQKRSVRFLHFNHTNPVIHPESIQRQIVMFQGFNVAAEGEVFELSA